MDGRRVAMGISFYPRGGSAQVVRYLAAALADEGWAATVFTGSLGPPDVSSNAATFYRGLDLVTADFTEACASVDAGGDPMQSPIPLHPSFEDREGAPDRLLTALDDDAAERQVALWARLFTEGRADECALFHLHHLTAQHEAATRAFPGLPVVAHLHGTELKMIDGIRRRRAVLDRLGTTFEEMAQPAVPASTTDRAALGELSADETELLTDTRWVSWRHADAWYQRLRASAHRAAHLICISDHDHREAVRLLGLGPDQLTVVRNGVDISLFDDHRLPPAHRYRHWRHWLVDEPLGWDASGRPGSRRCTVDEFDRFFPDPDATGSRPPVLLFIGRFLGFKRVPLLIRAYAHARSRTPAMAAPLVIWGGNPGEWEGEHPASVVDELGIDGVFFVGWRGHDELPTGINCADVMAAPSFDEPFGQVYLEAMACGRPVIGTRTGGPVSFVNTDASRPNGWLVPPDDEEALARALVAATTDDDDRGRRGSHAYQQIRARYGWSAVAGEFADVYQSVL